MTLSVLDFYWKFWAVINFSDKSLSLLLDFITFDNGGGHNRMCIVPDYHFGKEKSESSLAYDSYTIK